MYVNQFVLGESLIGYATNLRIKFGEQSVYDMHNVGCAEYQSFTPTNVSR